MACFAPEDRHNWLETILRQGLAEGQGLDQVGAGFASMSLLGTGTGTGTGTGAGTGAGAGAEMEAEKAVLGERSWREALVYLRTMFPGAGNYSGVGLELDDSDTAICWRIADMRDNLSDNLRRGANKALAARGKKKDRDLVGGMTVTGTMVGDDALGPDNELLGPDDIQARSTFPSVEPINIYASRLSADPEEEDQDAD